MREMKPTCSPPGLSSWATTTFIFTNVGLVLAVGWGIWRFGSVATAMTYLKGERLLVETATKDAGRLAPDRVHSITVKVMNRSGKTVRLVGANTSCSCLVANELPSVLPPGGDYPLTLQLDTKGKTGLVAQEVRLFTDYPRQRELSFTVTAVIAEGDTSP